MRKMIIMRFLSMIPTLLGTILLSFSLIYIAPGDAAQRTLTAQGMVTHEMIELKREEFGLTEPFLQQYGTWLWNVLRGDFGTSFVDGFPVMTKLIEAGKNTLILTGTTLVTALLFAIPLGMYSAIHKDKLSDYIIRLTSFLGNSIPNFLLCIILMYIFCIQFRWFSVISSVNFSGMILPTISLAVPLTSKLIRQIRAEMLEQLQEEYISNLRVRGIRKRYILFSNMFRNALPAIATVVGLAIGELIGGSVVIENIFGWPGFGRLVMEAISNRDYPVIQGFVVMISIVYMFLNLGIDVLHYYLDPRLKRGEL